MNIQIKILNKNFYEKNLPSYQTSGSAAMDLICTEAVTLYPGECKLISTGLAIWIGSGAYEYQSMTGRDPYTNDNGTEIKVAGLILPRSGLGHRGLVLGNTIGLLDEDFQGEIKVSAWNRNENTDALSIYKRTKEFFYAYIDDIEYQYEKNKIEIKAGERFCQLMFVPVIKASWQVVDEFSDTTNRGQGGFGSTNG
jgi:dUTP pyrophosphatase